MYCRPGDGRYTFSELNAIYYYLFAQCSDSSSIKNIMGGIFINLGYDYTYIIRHIFVLF